MRLYVGAVTSPVRSGIEARCSELRLCGHGKERPQALDSLRNAVLAWCIGLREAGVLEAAIEDKGLAWTPDGMAIDVEIEDLGGVA